ncbi:pilus assembly protein [Lachnospiraceae bacterium OttesenSCG-928-D06]|nr:pilus assembly protein [Lachnospiraceae bacterium OttesenSCG-928-D06]
MSSSNIVIANRKKTEDGYALVENMIVLPIVFLVVFAMLFLGFMLHAKTTIESAAKRGTLYASKLICDPQYEKIVAEAIDETKGELNELSSKEFDFSRIEHYEPYRYIPFLSSKFSSGGTTDLEASVQAYVQKIMNQNSTWMFTMDTDSIECEVVNYVLYQKVVVKIKTTYHLPAIFGLLGIPETYDLVAEEVLTVSDQDEFIRNVDFAQDLIVEIADSTGITKAIGEPLGKLSNFVKKLFK